MNEDNAQEKTTAQNGRERNHKMKLEQLVTEFAAAAGIANPVAVEGVWKFSADGHVFSIAEDDSGNDVWIYGEIPAPSPEREAAFRQAALEANFFMQGTCGAVFSINPESGAYTLMKSMSLGTATQEDFFAFVEKFVNTLATWQELSNATKQASGGDAPQEAPGEQSKPRDEKPGEFSGNDAAASFPGMLRV